uniref:Uncharacterized protein n=1 Tax=Zonotrichia albicollis TaxID=44394 RepID=A0A8D2N6J6_ZONAL
YSICSFKSCCNHHHWKVRRNFLSTSAGSRTEIPPGVGCALSSKLVESTARTADLPKGYSIPWNALLSIETGKKLSRRGQPLLRGWLGISPEVLFLSSLFFSLLLLFILILFHLLNCHYLNP